MTDFELTTPPDDQWAKDVCKIGQGKACCRFLTMAAEGFSCEKFSRLGPILTAKSPKMTAQSDNCLGRIRR